MRLLTIIFLCFGLSIGAYAKTSRIIGGSPAVLRDYPFIVSIRLITINQFICAGSIVSHWHVLTSSYCVFHLNQHVQDVRIYAGSVSSTTVDATEFGIDHIILHDEFMKSEIFTAVHRFDIAIVKVDRYIEFTEFINKIELPTQNIVNGNLAVIVGWGLTYFPAGRTSEKLRKAPMSLYDNFYCSENLPTVIYHDQLCAFNDIGVGACSGDSGGPVIHDGKLVGIISLTFGCAIGIPDIHTNIYPYLNFITNNISND